MRQYSRESAAGYRTGAANHSTASGGISIAIECGNPCHGIASAFTPPILPTFDPPYAPESELRISRYRPELGTPIRKRLRSTGEKLQTQTIRRPLEGAIRMNAIRLLAASSASIHLKPDGSVSASHSAGSSR